MSFKTGLVAVVAGLVGAALGVLLIQATSGPDTAAADQAAAELREQIEDLDDSVARADRRLDGMDRDLESLRRSVDGVADGVRGLSEGIERLRSQTATPRTARTPGVTHGFGAAGRTPEPAAPQVATPPRVADSNVAKLARSLLESTEDAVRFPAATELGRLGDAEGAVPALVSAVGGDKHFLVRRAAARSLGMLKAWYATPALIDAFEDREAYVAQQASMALQKITRNDFGVTQDMNRAARTIAAEKARRWWEQNQNSPPDDVSLVRPD